MAVNLIKNKEALVAAWECVVNDKSSTNWAVFSYEGQTNVLKLVSTGNGGLEEMIEELNCGLIMYAFCRVIDIKTTLPKCLLINWQGEGAPIVRKGTCANHIRDIERLLKGAHITISARSEEDVEVDLIMEKLSRATASSYKFNEPRGENEAHVSGPVGTTYRRVIPTQEINASERDQFWQKEEIEEQERLEQERIRRERNRKELEEEARRCEEVENKAREMKVTEKEDIVAEQRQAEQRAEEMKNLRNQKLATINKNNDSDEEPKSNSEELRMMRSKEAQQLIAQRTINARAIFEQNSSAGQTQAPLKQTFKGNNKIEAVKKAFEQSHVEKLTHEKPLKFRNKINDEVKVDKMLQFMSQNTLRSQTEIQQQQQSIATVETQLPSQVQSQMQQISEKQNNMLIKLEEQTTPQIIQNFNNLVSHHDSKPIDEIQQISQLLESQPLTTGLKEAENELYGQLDSQQYLYLDPNNQGMKAKALYDYQAADETEITFDPGDIITHIDAIDEGWWQGLAPDGTYGLFPANHVEVINENDAT